MTRERCTPRLRKAASSLLTARKAAEATSVTARKAEKAQARAAVSGGPAAMGVGSFRERLDWRWLCRVLRAFGVAPLDVEDVAQEVLLAAGRIEPGWQVRPGQTLREARRQLLRMVARWEVTEYVAHRARRRTSRQRYERAQAAPTFEASPEERLLACSRGAELRAAIDRLIASPPRRARSHRDPATLGRAGALCRMSTAAVSTASSLRGTAGGMTSGSLNSASSDLRTTRRSAH
jgi:hypothetical protein